MLSESSIAKIEATEGLSQGLIAASNQMALQQERFLDSEMVNEATELQAIFKLVKRGNASISELDQAADHGESLHAALKGKPWSANAQA